MDRAAEPNSLTLTSDCLKMVTLLCNLGNMGTYYVDKLCEKSDRLWMSGTISVIECVR